jgi:arylsulfatase A-like enzyme
LPTIVASSWITTALASLAPGQSDNAASIVRKHAPDINAEFLDWHADYDGARPFFAFLNYFDAHSPYETHPPFDTKFSATPPRYWLMRGWQRSYTEAEMQEFVDAYESAIAYLDHQIGELLSELEARGVLDNTLLVIVSDHGESLGENDILVHANSLYMPQLRVPLGIRMPGRAPAGLRIDSPVSLRDLPATVLDLVGLNATLPGRSLRSLWQPGVVEPADADRNAGAFSELTYNRFAHADDPIQLGLMRSIVHGRWHYIRNGDGSEELYDFRSDPDETDDLAAGEAGRAALTALRGALRAHLEGGVPAVAVGGSSPSSRSP